MNRSARRHRSTKVPNVKLRPAPTKEAAQARPKGIEEDERAEEEAMRHYRALREAHAAGKRKAVQRRDEGDESEDEEEGRDSEDHAPLVGCVICTTGFDEEKVSKDRAVVI